MENYTRALEQELQRLQEAIALQKEFADAHVENQVLKDIPASHGLSVPLGSHPPITSPPASAQNVLQQDFGSPECIAILLTRPNSVLRSYTLHHKALSDLMLPLNIEADDSAPRLLPDAQRLVQKNHGHVSGLSTTNPTTNTISSLVVNITIVGFDFILK